MTTQCWKHSRMPWGDLLWKRGTGFMTIVAISLVKVVSIFICTEGTYHFIYTYDYICSKSGLHKCGTTPWRQLLGLLPWYLIYKSSHYNFFGDRAPLDAIKDGQSSNEFQRLDGIRHKRLPHANVIKWKHFPRYWPFVWGIYRSPVISPHKGQWRGALIFSLIYAWTKGWVNNRDAGGLGRYFTHYDVTVMQRCSIFKWVAVTLRHTT